jgi:indole-3-glycerol phosphate synthase
MDILNTIVNNKKIEVEQLKRVLPPFVLYDEVERMIAKTCPPPSMKDALMRSPTGIIAEFKRRSPSKGWIKEEGRADIIPLQYQQEGAAAVSILTDSKFFGGQNRFVAEAIGAGVNIPILYKNFIIDEYQLYQARRAGASAVLLIAADLSIGQCKNLLDKAHQLQLEVLLEMHGREELDYAQLEPDLYGINNRNLGSFVTDVENSFRMAEALPKGKCWVSESGISNVETVKSLRQIGYRGFLIGEFFMRQEKPVDALRQVVSLLEK